MKKLTGPAGYLPAGSCFFAAGGEQAGSDMGPLAVFAVGEAPRGGRSYPCRHPPAMILKWGGFSLYEPLQGAKRLARGGAAVLLALLLCGAAGAARRI